MMGDDGRWWVSPARRVVGGGDGAGCELWGALSGAASEFAQMGEHPLTGGLQDAVGTEHAGIMELRDVECAQRSCSAVDSQMRGFAGERARAV